MMMTSLGFKEIHSGMNWVESAGKVQVARLEFGNYFTTAWCLNLWDTRLQMALPGTKPRSEGEYTRTLCQEQSPAITIQVAGSTAGQRNF